jgi:hypothetical protein
MIPSNGNEKASVNERFWAKLDSLVGFSFPLESRRFITMRDIAIAVLCLFAFNVALEILLVRIGQLPVAEIQSIGFAHSPEFLIPYCIFLAVGFTFITRVKVKPEHAYLKACIFGMLFAGFLATCWILLLPTI